MIELLNDFILLWWHWIVFGLVLWIIELTTGTFILLGIGASAILVGIIDFFFPTSFSTELVLWMLFSIVTIIIWYKHFREPIVSKSGQSNNNLETLGTITESITIEKRGLVSFDTPVLGNTTWVAMAKTDIPKDARVKIVVITGNLIEVTIA